MHDDLVTQLRRDEGEVLHAYKDSKGYLTIGVGRLIDKKRGGGITREESAMLLRNDIDRLDKDLQAKLYWYPTLSPARKGVIQNMAFQLGTAGLMRFKRFLTCVAQGEYKNAAFEMLDSKWAREDSPERARRLSKQMILDEWQ